MTLQESKISAMRCTRCAYCKWIPLDLVKSQRFSKGCPSVEYFNFHTFSAGGRLVTSLSLHEGRIDIDERVVDSVFACQMCGLCDVSCKFCRYDMEPLTSLHELREHLVSEGRYPKEHEGVLQSFRNLNNMLKKPAETRGDWAAGLNVKDLTKEKAEYVFHAGCQYSYDPKLQKVARICVEILQKAGIDFGIMGNAEHCCGSRIYQMGHDKDYAKAAEYNIKAWENAGVKKVITACADGYYAFKRLYPKNGSKIDAIHMVEFVDQLIREGKLKFTKTINKKVTYHDPCYLGRQGEPYEAWDGKEKKIFGQVVVYEPRRPRYNGAKGVYDPPRNILKAIPGVELLEMERIREATWCCGAGGGVRESYPEFNLDTASERILEAQSTGAEAIVTACPWCEKNFMDVGTMEVLDIMELVQQAI